MPRTTFRLRVQPILKREGDEPVIGEWSEVTNIATKDAIQLVLGSVATFKGNQVYFDKPGTISASYGYSFGDHFWTMQI